MENPNNPQPQPPQTMSISQADANKIYEILQDMQQQHTRDMQELKTEMKAEVAEAKTEMKAEVVEAKTEMKAEVAEAKAEMKAEMRAEVIKLGMKVDKLDTKVDGVETRINAEITVIKGSLDNIKFFYGGFIFVMIAAFGIHFWQGQQADSRFRDMQMRQDRLIETMIMREKPAEPVETVKEKFLEHPQATREKSGRELKQNQSQPKQDARDLTAHMDKTR